jgi:organic radical activating enzyme
MNKLKILDVFYGNKCNLTCVQCDTRSDIFRKGEHDPSLESIKEGVLLAAKHFKIESYSLLGGEPLLNLPIVEEILKFIRSFDSTTTILLPTNGALINKHLDKLSELISQYRVYLVVCDHFAAFEDQSRSATIIDSLVELAARLNIVDTEPNQFHKNILNFKDQSTDWQAWLQPRNEIGFNSNGDKYWTDGSKGISLYGQKMFHKHHYFNNSTPKPYAEGKPDDSYLNGCCSAFCTYLYDKKLYKCGALGTLKRFLEYHDSVDDPVWQRYLAYKPLDLTQCTDQEVENFSNTKFKSIPECDMCPSSSKEYLKVPETVLPNSKRYVPISKVD